MRMRMFNSIKEIWNEYSIERIKRKYPNNTMARIIRLAKVGEPEAVQMLEEQHNEMQAKIEKFSEELYKRRLAEYYSGNISSLPTRKDIKEIKNMSIGEGYSFEEITRMINNMKDYRNKIILFFLTLISAVITVISAAITIIGFICK